MLKKIISGGQTSADQAALDAAIKLGIDHGGWIPKGRTTETGILHENYDLREMPTNDQKLTRMAFAEQQRWVTVQQKTFTKWYVVQFSCRM